MAAMFAVASSLSRAGAADPSMATIRVETDVTRGGVRLGTAFRVSDGVVVTAAHTLATCSSATVAGLGSSESIARAPGGADIAVVRVTPGPGSVLAIDKTMPAPGTEATHVGYTASGLVILRSRAIGLAWMVSGGSKASVVEVYALEPGRWARHGMSGAPVMVAGRVVGVHVAEQPRRGRVLVVPIASAVPLLDNERAGASSLPATPSSLSESPKAAAVRTIRCRATGDS